MNKKTLHKDGRARRQIPTRMAIFILPLVMVAGVYIAMQLANRFDQNRESDASPWFGGVARKSLESEAIGIMPSTQIHNRQLSILTGSYTKPSAALPNKHTFPTLPDGLKAKGPVAVQLRLLISTDGTVTDATVDRSTGPASLDQNAVDWVEANWRYRPATKGKRAVASTTTAVVFFQPPRGSNAATPHR